MYFCVFQAITVRIATMCVTEGLVLMEGHVVFRTTALSVCAQQVSYYTPPTHHQV